MVEISNEVKDLDYLKEQFSVLKNEIAKIIIGQDQVVEELILSIFCRGHVLLVGVPGLAKTLLVKTISDSLGIGFSRIQFTPDLMPSDIIGADILDENRNFKFIKGPIFSNVILADEINRTPPKTQAALLEAMQERSVTAGGHVHSLDRPFFVLATQNPIEQEGTYPLPEAQLDRFMFNLKVNYPTYNQEIEIVKQTTSDINNSVSEVLSSIEIIRIQNLIRKIPVSDNLVEYAVMLVAKTRPDSNYATQDVKKYISWGAGPRASQFLVLAAKAYAAFDNRSVVTVDDISNIIVLCLRHRLRKDPLESIDSGAKVRKIFNEIFEI